MEHPTQRLEAFQPRKSDRIKALTPILLAIISVIGSILVAFFQFSASDRADAQFKQSDSVDKATEQKIEFMVDQINKSIIPAMQTTIQQLSDKNVELLERIVRLETMLDMKKEENLVHRIYRMTSKENKTDIPKLRMKK